MKKIKRSYLALAIGLALAFTAPQAEPGSTEADEQQDCPCDEVSLRQQIEAAESQEAKENRIPRLDHDIEPLRDSPHMNPS